MRRFSNFHFPKASKIELVCLEKLGHFIRKDSGMWLLAHFLQPCTVRGLNIGQFKGFSLGPLGLYLSSKFVHSIIFWIEGGNKNKMSSKITA